MAKLNVLDINGNTVSDIELNDSVFGIEPHQQAMFDAIVSQQSALRQGTKKTKTKGEVAGGGRKPFRQKGTGRARAGSTRSPIWVGGGTVFGPTGQENYKKHVNKKVRKLALKSLLSLKVKEESLIVVDSLKLDTPSTKGMKDVLAKLKADRNVIIAVDTLNDDTKNTVLSVRNLSNVSLTEAAGVNALDIMWANKMVVTVDAIKKIEEALS